MAQSIAFYNPEEQKTERKRRMAQALMEQGKQPEKTEMVSGWAVPQSPIAGLAKALSQGLGGVVDHQVDKQEAQRAENARQTMANAVKAFNESQAGGQTQLQNGESITWNKMPLDNASKMYADLLMQNPDTAPFGMDAQIGQMQAKQNMANELDMYRQKFPMELELAKQRAAIEAQYRAPPSSVQEWQFGQSHPEFLKYQQNEASRASKVWGDAQQLVAASQAAGQPIDIMTAYGMAKSGLGVGRTMQDGAVAPMVGALDTAKDFKSSEAAGSEIGKQEGEAQAKLQALQAQYPRLEQVTAELSNLGKKATYTTIGRGKDTAMREAGLPVGEGAIARSEYISKVDNEVLPLLRQTFGAQFTQKEGESLKATLGDPNKSPEEKDAVLRSFIQQKAAEIETLQRQVGPQGQGANPAVNQPYDQIQPKIINWEDLP